MDIDYAKNDYKWIAHHVRYVRRVESMPHKLTCQFCGGRGSFTERILDDGTGPSYDCGYCEGTGYVTPWLRGLYLRHMREARRASQSKAA